MSGKQKECGYSWTSEGEIHTCSLPEGHTEAHICGFVFNPDDCCLERAAPTPPEGEAVPELSDFEGIPKGIANTVSGPEPPAPVVSTAAPEPDEPQWFQKKPVKIRALQDSGARLFITTLEGTMEAQVLDWIICGVKGEFYPCKPEIFEASYTPVAPESYKPAEGPDLLCGNCVTGDCMSGDHDCNKASCQCPQAWCVETRKENAATPVTVEAPEPCFATQEEIAAFQVSCLSSCIKFVNSKGSSIQHAKKCPNNTDPAATPKPIGDVEAVARQIATYVRGEFYKPLVCKPENDYLLEGIGKILSPFFAPAPPCSECATLQKQITEIAEAVSRMPTVTGLQESCVKDHSLITLAILDSQATFNDTVARKEAECATLRKERDEAKKSLESELHYTNCDKLHRERETKRHWQDRAEAAEAQLSTLRDALRGMLESYDLLIEQSQSHFKSETLKGVIEGSFVGEITRARKLLAPTPEVAPVKILRGQRKVSLELEHESEKGTHSIGEVAPKE